MKHDIHVHHTERARALRSLIAVQKHHTTLGARNWIKRARRAQANSNSLQELVVGQYGAVVLRMATSASYERSGEGLSWDAERKVWEKQNQKQWSSSRQQ